MKKDNREGVCDICGRPDDEDCNCFCSICGEPECNGSCCCPVCGPDGCDCSGETRDTEGDVMDEDTREAYEHAMEKND